MTRHTWMRAGGTAFLLAGLALAAPQTAAQTSDTQAKLSVMSEGKGWKLLEVKDLGTPESEPGKLVWMVNRGGLKSLPVTEFEKNELEGDFEPDDPAATVIFVNKEVSEAVQSGQLPPGYGGYGGGAIEGCFGWDTYTKSKDYTFNNQSPQGSFSLGGNLSGTYGVNIPLTGQVHLDLRYKLKKFACVPYKFKFLSAHVHGNLTLSGDSDLSASVAVSGHWDKEWKLFEPTIGSFTVWLGPIPVQIEITLPTYAGVSVDATLTGTVGVDSDFGASGTFNYDCTPDGCTGTNSFTDHFDTSGVTASLQLDLAASAFARVMGRVAVYDDSIAYVEAGLKGLITADIWGYYGNTCGDADGNGQNETVRALVADVNWGYDVVYGIGGFLLPDRDWTNTGPRYPLGWHDFLGQGGSTALQPMLLGPAQVDQGSGAAYTVKMRPCYPYSERVNFTIAPGAWSGNTYIDKPKSANASENSSSVSRSFNTAGSVTLVVTNTTDGNGRGIQVPYARTIQVGPPPCTDTTAPTATLTAPAAGARIWGNAAFSANASDNVGVTRVDFEVNGAVVCSDSTAPWSCSADVNGYTTGDYSVRARAFDACDNVGTSAAATVRIVSNPEAFIDLPSAGGTVSGESVTVRGWATDPDRVTTLTVKIDGQTGLPPGYGVNRVDVCQAVPVGDPNCPNVGFQTTFNSTQFANGTHSVTVTATDATGRTTTLTRSFVVDNPPPAVCTPGATTLCLRNNRFKVQVSYLNGSTGAPATARPYSDLSGFFWFFSAGNTEVGVKVLGPGSNGYYWIFHGGATDRQYTLSVTDTQTGTVRTYVKPQGSFCGGTDLSAFPGSNPFAGELPEIGDAPTRLAAEGFEDAPDAVSAACTPSSTAVCLQADRFKVEVLRGGAPQAAIEQTAETGVFWFFNADNAEIFVKVLDATTVNGHFWVYYGALSDRDYTVRVTDTQTGAVRTYVNALGNYCGAGDSAAF